ncbi:MAG: UDP-N-acetylmuramoyl-tripeptide--D-alanyl-D-alanine ligase [Synergistaceae bacterium]|jgi:UDP-N-acetylmuramoyl-tripeptide--D-alanyl-D-alanine ligase|nr:UDP-N-acetylmuramoyl-tripeptide--D-alanyl-D-alanine ligase [Synergistaceae bacterium]
MTRILDFFTIAEAALITGADFFPSHAGMSVMSQNFRCDSRDVERGDVFVAMPGERDDGHNYIKKSVESGASCVILDAAYFEENQDEMSGLDTIMLVVSNSSGAMAKLARAWLDKVSPRVVGITGSVGKTTTREFLRSALKDVFLTHSAKKSYNTMVGCGMTILAMPRNTEVLILELGTSHIGDIEELVKNFPVTHGIITEAAPAHLDGLKSLDGVVAAKMEIMKSESMQFLSYNSDNENLAAAISRNMKDIAPDRGNINTISVGYSDSGVQIRDVRQSVSDTIVPMLSMRLSRGDRDFSCDANVFGRQHARNIAFAYAASIQLGARDEDFMKSVASFKIPSGRGVLLKAIGGGILVDESYNSNPSSVSHALKNLLELELEPEFRRIAILGGMRELGEESARWHEIIRSRASLLDELYLIGSEWGEAETKSDALKGIWGTVDEFILNFDFKSLPKSIILIKGSRFYGLDRLLKYFEAERNDN